LLLFVVFWSCGGFPAFKPTRLAVVLAAVEADPMHHLPRERATVLNGITGLCAIFAVTNLSQEDSVWFDTCAVEQKVEGKWLHMPVPPYARRVTDQIRAGRKPWYGIASDEVNHIYPPGTCWNYAVAWPPDLPTNAVWRLQLRYGRQPSPKAKKIDDAIRINLFARHGKGDVLFTPEVKQ
jgi:hypothetical protein